MATELVPVSELDHKSEFYRLFSRNVFHSKYQSRRSGTWETLSKYLGESRLKAAFDGTQRTQGFFSRIQSRMVCLDVDDHAGNDPIDTRLRRVHSLFGVTPSMVEKTPRGAHVFYFLSDWVNSQLFAEGLQSALRANGIRAEVKGTFNQGLSVPLRAFLTDGNCEEYPSSVFSSVFPSGKPKRTATVRQDVIFPGETNDALCSLVPYMKFTLGLSDAETAASIQSMLSKSYEGELRNRIRLLKRVSSFRDVGGRIPIRKKVLETRGLEETMREVSSRLGRDGSPLRRVVKCLLDAKEAFLDATSTPDRLHYMNGKYPYTKWYAGKGATPVPSTLLQKANSRYSKAMKELEKIGFVSLPDGRHYDVARHSCIHYVIGFQKEVVSYVKSLALAALEPTQSSDYVLNCRSDLPGIESLIPGWTGFIPESPGLI